MYLSIAAANVVLFVGITGGRIVLPSNTDWLMWGDSAQHYLGWELFRVGPLGLWPPGASPAFGVGYSSSIVFSDSIPLLAIPMKFLLVRFSGQFQFLGVWILICFLLQGLIGAAILRSLRVSTALIVPLSIFFSITPAFLYRLSIGGFGHVALFSHFLILTSFYLSIQTKISHARWTLLLLVSVLVQFYLAIMVIAIYLGTITYHRFRHRGSDFDASRSWTRRWLIPQFLTIVAVMYTAGYFMGSAPSDEGFGIFRADLLAFFDPNSVDLCCWSGVLPDLELIDGSHEGFAYLGSGVLVTLVAITAIIFRQLREPVRRLAPIMLSAIPLMILGLSNRIQIAGEEYVTIPIGWLDSLAGVIRSSGRFVWPLMYLAVVIATLSLATLYSRHKTIGLVAVTLVLTLQLFESWPALRETHERFTESRRNTPVLVSPRWESVLKGRECLLTSPPQAKGKLWIDFAELASRNRVSTNASYLSRWDQSVVAVLSEEIAEQLDRGDVSENCLYVLISPDSEDEFFYLQTVRTPDGRSYDVETIDGFITVGVSRR